MRIGSNSSAFQNVSNDTGVTSTGGGSKTRTGETEADIFAEDTVTVGGLTSRAMQSPDIRHDTVERLQQSVSDGNYELDAQAIAEAMLYA